MMIDTQIAMDLLPAGEYNAFVQAIKPYSIDGCIWYQIVIGLVAPRRRPDTSSSFTARALVIDKPVEPRMTTFVHNLVEAAAGKAYGLDECWPQDEILGRDIIVEIGQTPFPGSCGEIENEIVSVRSMPVGEHRGGVGARRPAWPIGLHRGSPGCDD